MHKNWLLTHVPSLSFPQTKELRSLNVSKAADTSKLVSLITNTNINVNSEKKLIIKLIVQDLTLQFQVKDLQATVKELGTAIQR